MLLQAAFVASLDVDFVPERRPAIHWLFAVVYGALVGLIGRAFRGRLRVVLVAWWLLTGAAMVALTTFEFFPDELTEAKSWPDVPNTTAYIYTDSFRRKIVTVKLRDGRLPVMRLLGTCVRDEDYAAQREADDFVFRCQRKESRTRLRVAQSKHSE